ncbi:MAG: OmpH family outer membrane protein [bacterium]|nr:OmpH family outer membrane protein [bacterium]
MKFKSVFFLFIMVFLTSTAAAQEVKIGYTNIELILAYMPEAKQLDQEISTLQEKLGKQLQDKQTFAQQRMATYMEKKEANTLSKEQNEQWQAELMKLDNEISDFAKDGEAQLLARREELMAHILEKLQSAIDEVAEENGYTYLLNQTTSSGVSTILYGPDENDVTEAVMKKLNIQMPK